MEYRYDDLKRTAEAMAGNPVAASAAYAAYVAGFMDLAEAMREYDDVPDALEERVMEAHGKMKALAIKALTMAAGLGREDSE